MLPPRSVSESSLEISETPLLSWLKYPAAITATPLLTVLSCVPIPILSVIAIEETFHRASVATWLKLTGTLLPWLLFSLPRGWLVWNVVGRRLVDHEETPIGLLTSGQLQRDSAHVAIALLANTLSIPQGLLIAHSFLATIDWRLFLVAGVVIGVLLYALRLFTEIPVGFRAHAQYCEAMERPIYPLFSQPLVRPFYRYVKEIGMVLKTVYPIFVGLVTTVASVLELNSLMSDCSAACRLPIVILEALLIYSSTAFLKLNFEMAHLKDHVVAMDEDFSLLVCGNNTSNPCLSFVRAIFYGKCWEADFRQLGVSRNVNIGLAILLSTFGQYTVFIRLVRQYIITDDVAAIEEGRGSKLLTFYWGENTSKDIGADAFLPLVGLISGLACAFTFSKIRKVTDEALRSETGVHLNQVLPIVDGTMFSRDNELPAVDEVSEDPALPTAENGRTDVYRF
jgi:hypothetical protein